MRKNHQLLLLALGCTVLMNACKKDETTTPPTTVTPSDKPVVVVKDSITSNVTWNKDTIYFIKGYFFVYRKGNAFAYRYFWFNCGFYGAIKGRTQNRKK